MRANLSELEEEEVIKQRRQSDRRRLLGVFLFDPLCFLLLHPISRVRGSRDHINDGEQHVGNLTNTASVGRGKVCVIKKKKEKRAAKHGVTDCQRLTKNF